MKVYVCIQYRLSRSKNLRTNYEQQCAFGVPGSGHVYTHSRSHLRKGGHSKNTSHFRTLWEFPKIGDPNIVP